MNTVNQTIKKHRDDLDLLKGFAIVAVVLYHMGICRSGYLGVDAFFVINGFLVVPGIVQGIDSGEFRFFPFLGKRIARLLPLVLLVSFLCLLLGFWMMLPDDYENLGESVVATGLFSNNILASLTTNNYWATSNDYLPLMHTWFVGVLFQFYVVFPLIVMLVKWLSRKCHFGYYKYTVLAIIALSVISVLMYLHPDVGAGDKFYLLPYRFFELAGGGLAGLWIRNHHGNMLYRHGFVSGVGFVLLLAIIFFGVFSVGGKDVELNIVHGAVRTADSFIPQSLLLLATVLLTVLYVLSDNERSRIVKGFAGLKFICLLGLMSYSIYIWHQPILAFYRYLVSSVFPPLFVVVFFVAVLAVSYASYRLVEQGFKLNKYTGIGLAAAFVLVVGAGIAIYMHAGVVRDVPELYIRKDNVHRNLHAEYVDRIFSYDKDFPADKEGKINVLVEGNSFARDWCNILLESGEASRINLSYIPKFGEKYVDRIKEADCVFVFEWKHDVPYYVWQNVRSESAVWGIGNKNFGECNGTIYKHRHRDDYYRQTVKINPSFFEVNEQLKAEWADQYIDLMTPVVNDGGEVIVFSEDGKFMSQDCYHLSQGGAQFYAQRLDLRAYLGGE